MLNTNATDCQRALHASKAVNKKKDINLRRTGVQKAVFIAVFVIFLIYALSLLYPFFWGILSSLKDHMEYTNNPFAFPENWLFSNYIDAFEALEYNETNFIGMTFNSIWFTFGGTAINVIVVCMTSYVVAKYRFKGRALIYGISVFIMVVPIVGSLPAAYRLYAQLGFINSPLILITYAGGFGFNFIIMYGYFKSLPWSYAEAAMIDGAGHFSTFVKVMLPQALTSMLAISIILAIGIWNDYLTPMLYLDEMPTLASGLYSYQTIMEYKINMPVLYAGIFLSMLPIVVIYGLFHNIIMENTVTGGLKG